MDRLIDARKEVLSNRDMVATCNYTRTKSAPFLFVYAPASPAFDEAKLIFPV